MCLARASTYVSDLCQANVLWLYRIYVETRGINTLMCAGRTAYPSHDRVILEYHNFLYFVGCGGLTTLHNNRPRKQKTKSDKLQNSHNHSHPIEQQHNPMPHRLYPLSHRYIRHATPATVYLSLSCPASRAAQKFRAVNLQHQFRLQHACCSIIYTQRGWASVPAHLLQRPTQPHTSIPCTMSLYVYPFAQHLAASSPPHTPY